MYKDAVREVRKPSSGESTILSKPFTEIHLPCGSETLFSQ